MSGSRILLADDSHPLEAVQGVTAELVREIEKLTEEEESSSRQGRCFRELVNLVGEGLCMVGLAGEITMVNEPARRMLGTSKEEAIGRPLVDFLSEEAHSHVEAGLTKSGTGSGVRVRARILRQDGVEVWVAVSTGSLVDESGKRIGGVALLSDVTERVEADRILRASEARYRTLAESVDDVIHVKDSAGRYLFANSAMARRMNRPVEEVIGKTASDIYALETAKKVAAEDAVVLTSGAVLDDEEVHQTPAGPRVYNVRKSPLHNEAGETVGVVTVSRDITDHKRSEQALREREEQLRLITDNMQDVIVQVDAEGITRWVSPSIKAVLGYEPEMVLGRAFVNGLHPEDREQVMAAAARRVVNGPPGPRVARYKHASGHYVWLESVGQSLLDERGGVIGAVFVSRDVSEKRRTEQALAEANQKLTGWVKELERQGRETALLKEMGDLLQSCLDFREAYSVISQFTHRLFPGRSGALFVMSPSRDILEATATWGKLEYSENAFAPAECWSLRRGKCHLIRGAKDGPHCQHMPADAEGSTLCVAMMAQGDTLGVFYLEAEPEGAGDSGPAFDAIEQRLASMVSDHLSMAVANLKLRETLRNQAIRDPLTGLFNRRYMEETLEREVRRAVRKEAPLAVIMMDVDHFKQFNDEFGHDAGDAVLHAIGVFFKSSIRVEDIACRYGGEEFVLILPEAGAESAVERAEQLRRNAGQLIVEHRGRRLGPVRLSLGVAMLPEQGSTGLALLQSADAALYLAKAEGRDRVVLAGASRSER